MRKSVNIFGKNIPVVLKKNLIKDEQAFGEYCPDLETIYIDADLPPKTASEALLHECGHALFHRAGLSQSGIEPEVENIIVEQFAIMFSENFLPKTRPKVKKKR